MADNGFKISKSVNLNPQTGAPSNPVNGDIYYDSNYGSFAFYHDGAWANTDSVGVVAVATDLTSTQFTPSVVQNATIKVTGTGASTLHGLTASHSGKRLSLYNSTDSTMLLKYQSVTEATSNNRIVTPTGGDMNLVAGEIVEFIYDVVASRWLLVSIGSGAGAYLPATTASPGIVRLNATPVIAGTPDVAVVDASNQVVGTGLTRGPLAAGAVSVAVGANDSSLVLGKSGAAITVNGTSTFAANATFSNGFTSNFISTVTQGSGATAVFTGSSTGSTGAGVLGFASGSGNGLVGESTGTGAPFKIEPRATAPTNVSEGQMYYDSVDDSLRVYSDGRFQQLNPIRAWLSFSVTNGAAPSVGQEDGCTVTRDTVTNQFTVTFDQALATGSYCALLTVHNNGSTGTYANVDIILKSQTRLNSAYSFSLGQPGSSTLIDIDDAGLTFSVSLGILGN